MKNDNLAPFFTILVANVEFANFAKTKIHGLDRLKPDREKKQSEHRDLPRTWFAI